MPEGGNMSKFGIGTSMKDAIRADVKEAEELLTKKQLTAEDKAALLNLLNEAEYQWCQANATARALEATVLRLLGAHDVASTAEAMGKLLHEFDHAAFERVMRETWPF